MRIRVNDNGEFVALHFGSAAVALTRPQAEQLFDMLGMWIEGLTDAEVTAFLTLSEDERAPLDDPCPRCGGDHDRIDRREPCPWRELTDDEAEAEDRTWD